MVARRHVARLTEAGRGQLLNRARQGRDSARRLNRARTPLKAGLGRKDARVAEALGLTGGAVSRIRKGFVGEGPEGALNERSRPGRPPKLDDRGEARLIALACSQAPEGHDRWTLRLPAGEAAALGLTESLCHQGVRRRLKKRAQAVAEEGVVHS